MNDPILDEIRAIKRKHAEKYGFDVLAMCNDIMKTQQERQIAGWKLLHTPAKPQLTSPNHALQKIRAAHP